MFYQIEVANNIPQFCRINYLTDIFLKKNTDNFFIQLFRYAIVGGLALCIDFFFLCFFTDYFKIYYLTSAALAFLLGLITNYLLSISWVFSNRVIDNEWLEFGIFLIIGLIGVGLTILSLWIFTEILHLHYVVSKLISTAFVFIWNFFARKISLFS